MTANSRPSNFGAANATLGMAQQHDANTFASNAARSRFGSTSSGPSPTSSTIATIRARDIRSRGIAEAQDIVRKTSQTLKYDTLPPKLPREEKKAVVRVRKYQKTAGSLAKVKPPPKKPREKVSLNGIHSNAEC